jgi:hypothetical protein
LAGFEGFKGTVVFDLVVGKIGISAVCKVKNQAINIFILRENAGTGISDGSEGKVCSILV